MKKLETKNSTALFTDEYLYSIQSMMDIEDKGRADKPSDWMQCAEDSRSGAESIAYLALGERREIEQVFTLNEFIHRQNIQSSDNRKHLEGQFHIAMQQQAPFDVLKIDACINRTLITSMRQCSEYCRTLNFPQAMKPITSRSLLEVRERSKAIGWLL